MIEHNTSGTAQRAPTPGFAADNPDDAGREQVHPWHPAPRTVADTGIDVTLLVGLLMKAAYLHRSAMLTQLADTLKLPATVTNEIASIAVRERMLEVAHRGASDLDVRFRLTDAGYARAAELVARSSYVGAAPVTLDAYLAAVQRHSVRQASVSREDMTAAFGGLVIPSQLLDEVGMAVNTGRALMLYGPAGSGKTYLAQRLGKLLPGAVPVPHAITVAGEIIQVFDPLVHVPFDSSDAPLQQRSTDRRWTICHRPAVLSGGELTLSMLDLRYDAMAGFYQAPPHMKANNGIYIVDDLGRQLVGVSELLNRWIVPLDRGVDMFSLQTGVRFTVPFDVWPVFSTNLDPQQLGDEAFLRRLGSKLFIGPLSSDDYREVYLRATRDVGLESTEAAFDFLLEGLHFPSRTPLLACIPRDLLVLVASSVLYHRGPPQVTPDALRGAWRCYFGAHAVPESTRPSGTGVAWQAALQAAS